MLTLVQLVALGICLAGFLVAVLRSKSSNRYPPGPRGLPVLGNILDMPGGHEWLTYRKWARLYSAYH
jgi:hypothetical protein